VYSRKKRGGEKIRGEKRGGEKRGVKANIEKRNSKSQVCWRRERDGKGSIHCNGCIFAMQTA
jgi:hypothetical protein